MEQLSLPYQTFWISKILINALIEQVKTFGILLQRDLVEWIEI
jgi:hypothetical protein